jgi:hypothetical protein
MQRNRQKTGFSKSDIPIAKRKSNPLPPIEEIRTSPDKGKITLRRCL